MPAPDRLLKRLTPHLTALAAVSLLTVVRILLIPVLGYELPFITLFPAVFFAAWYGGLGPAVTATVAGIAMALYFFFPPIYSQAATGVVGPLGAALFGLIGVAAGWLGQSRLAALEQAQAAARLAQTEAERAEEQAVRAEEEAVRAEEEAVQAEEERLRAEELAHRAERAVEEAEVALAQQLETETALRQSEERYRAFIEQTAEGVWRIELPRGVPQNLPVDEQIERFYADGILAECNDAMAHMYGYTRASDLVGARLADLLPRSDPNNQEFLRAFVQSGYRLTDAESHERDREGQERYFLNNLIGIVVDGQIVRAWGSQRDVTLSRQAEAELQRSEARFRSIFESGLVGIAFWNQEVVTGANDTFLGILGYDRQDLRNGLLRRERLFAPGGAEADARAYQEIQQRGSCQPYEKSFVRKDGSRIPVLVGAARLGPDMNDLVFFILDLTERHRAEERARQAERIEVVGQLAGGMAHEANNQMSVVLGAASFILSRNDLPDIVRQDVNYIQQAAERTAAITRQLLAFSRRQILQPRVVDLNEVLQHLEPILRRTLTEGQDLVLRLAPGLAPVRADPVQLDQVLLNLAINARDAMPQGGTLTVETRSVRITDQFIALHPAASLTSGPHVALIVSDTGQGMSQDTLKHLFEPFFTTKSVGEGSGLGLAMVYGIVKQSGGDVWAYSEPGMGTTLKLYLPAASHVPGTGEAEGSETPFVSPGGTVLVVEDDELVRTMAKRSLLEAGFQVIEAGDGRQAVALTEQHDGIDVVLTDLAMPEVGGRELARHLAQTRPGLPIIFMSGYTDDDLARRGLLEAGHPFLEKPFSPIDLAKKVCEVLDGRTDHV
ncbi:MAG TPA: response regulator [Gemmatimonadales bacterium]